MSTNMNATHARLAPAMEGSVACFVQDKEMGQTLIDWALKRHVSFSAFVGLGSNMIDVGWGDLIEYFGRDSETDAIVLYMNSIGDSIDEVRKFVAAARAVSLKKPILVVKSGRASDPSGDRILDTIFKQCGVLRVDTLFELSYMVQILGRQPRPMGDRLAIITNAPSPALASVDKLYQSGNAKLANTHSATTVRELARDGATIHPDGLVDLRSDASPEVYVRAIDAVSRDSNNDAILVILTPQFHSEATRTATLIGQRFQLARLQSPDAPRKPLFVCFMGGNEVEGSIKILTQAGIPAFGYPDLAADMFNLTVKHSHNLQDLYQSSYIQSITKHDDHIHYEKQVPLKKSHLNDSEARDFLNKCGVPVETLSSFTKFGARLDTNYSSRFGHVLSLKVTGDREQDVQFGSPPITSSQAHSMVKSCRAYHVMDQQDIKQLEDLIVEFSRVLAHLSGHIDSCEGIGTDQISIKMNHQVRSGTSLLLRPYPHEYIVVDQEVKNNIKITIRPARYEDHVQLLEFFTELPHQQVKMMSDEETALSRLNQVLDLITQRRKQNSQPESATEPLQLTDLNHYWTRKIYNDLISMCVGDYDREMVLVALNQDHIVALARYTLTSHKVADLSVLVNSEHQQHGVGAVLVKQLVNVARQEGIKKLVANVGADNPGMVRLCEKLNFVSTKRKDGVCCTLNL
ncbi:hypothetical protein AKO1_007534 [Acrasis kona]|uniref:N-acetyltransferase domain-containing protein n=1 Tax=Acrasis kona TaxID=1008807 RepID=A0AAW2YRH9_9EUKA